MSYEYRVKFSASLTANGDITPGSAVSGFKTHTLSSGTHTILIENPGTGAWQICSYDTGAASGSRRTMIEESAGSPFATLPMSGLVATFVAPTEAYVNAGSTGNSNVVVGVGGSPTSGNSNVVVGTGWTDKSNCIIVGNSVHDDYSGDLDGAIILGNGNSSVPTDKVALTPDTVNSTCMSMMLIDSAAAAGGAGTYALLTPANATLLRSGISGYGIGTRVKGTLIADIDVDHTYRRVWDVDYAVSESVLYSTFTVLATGGAGTLSLSVNSSGELSITTGGTYTGMKVAGVLVATKIIVM